VEPRRRDEFSKDLVGGIAAGIAAGLATYVVANRSVLVAAIVTVLMSIAGSAVGWLYKHDTKRREVAALALGAAALAVVVVVVGNPAPCGPKGVTCLVGGCARYDVYAQNRYQPLGTRKVAEPSPEGRKIGGFAPNELIPVDGWVRTAAPYLHNDPPINSNVWFHVADDSGWVAFAAVRAEPTVPAQDPFDPDGGAPAPTPDECHGSLRSNV
jgi:hypothetical protein